MERVMWRRSSYTGANGGNCVEVARAGSGRIAARDSKNRQGPQLDLNRSAFGKLLGEIKQGKHDLA